MPVKSPVLWGGPNQAKAKPEDRVSSYSLDVSAAHHACNDTVVETKGTFPDYRPGDIWKMLRGTVFQR